MKEKKKGEPARTSPGLRPRKKPLQLKVGKTYETGSGKIHVRVVSITDEYDKGWEVLGEVVRGALLTYAPRWRRDGLYHAPDYHHRDAWLDLVREVETRNASAKPAGRSRSKSSPSKSKSSGKGNLI
jgi:hypothetical protein